MIKRIYAVRDSLAGALAGGLIVLANDNVALRFLGDIMKGENNISAHPDDFELVSLGEIDEESDCVISAFVVPSIVMSCRKFLDLQATLAEAK